MTSGGKLGRVNGESKISMSKAVRTIKHDNGHHRPANNNADITTTNDINITTPTLLILLLLRPLPPRHRRLAWFHLFFRSLSSF